MLGPGLYYLKLAIDVHFQQHLSSRPTQFSMFMRHINFVFNNNSTVQSDQGILLSSADLASGQRMFLTELSEILQPGQPIKAMLRMSVYLNTLFLDRRTCAHFFARTWQLSFMNQQKGENDRRKYFIISLNGRMFAGDGEDRTHDFLITSLTRIRLVMHRLMWACVVRKSNKCPFHALRIIYYLF